ncbi:MAG: tRNA (guanosine(37)-N1)-methyltransferase TrmD, partial [Erysipelotrichaceae bacterium]|nr:tRNA (guanosine(37)-N1)-methyltransferase TrmD [Erysipelotrichaceae bacterium]
MKFSVLTLFPEMYGTFCGTSIVKHAIERGIAEIECINIRDFSNNKFRHIDDTPYGGGAGMLMQVEPIDKAIASVRKENSYVVLMSPKAKPYKQ